MLDSTLPIVTDLVRDAARPLTGSQADYDSLLEFIGNAHFVLLGEASMEHMSSIGNGHG